MTWLSICNSVRELGVYFDPQRRTARVYLQKTKTEVNKRHIETYNRWYFDHLREPLRVCGQTEKGVIKIHIWAVRWFNRTIWIS